MSRAAEPAVPLSDRLHGNPSTSQKDWEVRTWLDNEGYEVRSITVSQLDDKGAMAGHFFWLGQRLVGVGLAGGVRADADRWFRSRESVEGT